MYCKFVHSEIIFGPFEKMTFFGEHPLYDELCHQHDKLRLLKDAMHHQEIRRSSPLPTIPSPQERGAESKSMSVVPTSSTKPHTLSSQIHPTQARRVQWQPNLSLSNIQINCHHQMLLPDVMRSHLPLLLLPFHQPTRGERKRNQWQWHLPHLQLQHH